MTRRKLLRQADTSKVEHPASERPQCGGTIWAALVRFWPITARRDACWRFENRRSRCMQTVAAKLMRWSRSLVSGASPGTVAFLRPSPDQRALESSKIYGFCEVIVEAVVECALAVVRLSIAGEGDDSHPFASWEAA